MILKYIYIVFIGVLVSLFVGIGIAAFYPSPKSPDFTTVPMAPINAPLSASESAQIQKDNIKQQQVWNDYQVKSEEYNKNVSIICIILAISILAASILFAKYIPIISDGLLLGALFTLIYSIFRSFSSKDFKFMFIIICIGLIIALFLGYQKFIKAQSSIKTK